MSPNRYRHLRVFRVQLAACFFLCIYWLTVMSHTVMNISISIAVKVLQLCCFSKECVRLREWGARCQV